MRVCQAFAKFRCGPWQRDILPNTHTLADSARAAQSPKCGPLKDGELLGLPPQPCLCLQTAQHTVSRGRDTVSFDVSPWIGDRSETHSSPLSLFLLPRSLLQGPGILLVLLTPWFYILLQLPGAPGLGDEGPTPVLHGAPAAGCLVPKGSTVPALHLGRKEEGSVSKSKSQAHCKKQETDTFGE